MPTKNKIDIYTDGSCHTQLLTGAWAALVFVNGNKTILKGIDENTTHNRMELLAVINAINWVNNNRFANEQVTVYSDSQYVVNLIDRKQKLEAKNFITNKGTPIQNIDLVQTLLMLTEKNNLIFNKVKAHQKPDGTQNFNREVDLIVRKLVRENLVEHG